jgi:hypothetical protein
MYCVLCHVRTELLSRPYGTWRYVVHSLQELGEIYGRVEVCERVLPVLSSFCSWFTGASREQYLSTTAVPPQSPKALWPLFFLFPLFDCSSLLLWNVRRGPLEKGLQYLLCMGLTPSQSMHRPYTKHRRRRSDFSLAVSTSTTLVEWSSLGVKITPPPRRLPWTLSAGVLGTWCPRKVRRFGETSERLGPG